MNNKQKLENSIIYQTKDYEKQKLDISKQVRLVPKFEEKLELARTILFNVITIGIEGESSERFAMLTVEECADYETVKWLS